MIRLLLHYLHISLVMIFTFKLKFSLLFYIHLYIYVCVGISKWDNIEILTQVLATSQQEYLDNLKKQHDNKEENNKKYSNDADKPSTSR